MEALGHLTWYTIFDTEIGRATLLPRLEQCGLSDFAPAVIQAGDAFRRATHTLERLRVAQEDATFVNWLVREVRATDQQIVRHLVRETVDAAHVRLDYRAVLGKGVEEDAPEAYWKWSREKADAFAAAHSWTAQVVDEIILPRDTRKKIVQALKVTEQKAEELPQRKKAHGSPPT